VLVLPGEVPDPVKLSSEEAIKFLGENVERYFEVGVVSLQNRSGCLCFTGNFDGDVMLCPQR